MAKKAQLILVLATIFCGVSFATERKLKAAKPFSFASYYGDHMVLQKGPQPATIWGYGEKVGSTVTLTLTNHSAVSATVTSQLTWAVTLPPVSDTKNPYTITAVSDSKTISLTDVLFGDVWICSGQSNMVFTLDMVNNAMAEMDVAKNYPYIRLFTAALESSETPLTDLKSVEEPWSIPSQDTVGHEKWTYFSAVCWLYGKVLYETLNYPVGLITTAWGGTAIELWSPPSVLKQCGIPSQIDMGTGLSHSSLWNAMVLPFTQMSMYGVLWYQGESNAGDPHTYNCTFPAMIRDWRKTFRTNSGNINNAEFPFGFVQLAPNRDRSKVDVSTGFPDIRWHQTADVGYVPNQYMTKVFMAVAMDLPDFDSPYGSIHPRDKQDIATRLVAAALPVAYNNNTKRNFQGPLPDGYKLDRSDKTIHITFDNKTTHLIVKQIEGFEICCSKSNTSQCNDVTSKWVKAPIVDYDAWSLKVWTEACDQNDYIVGLRYEWRESPCDLFYCAVYSRENGLPTPPLITIGLFKDNYLDKDRVDRRVTYN